MALPQVDAPMTLEDFLAFDEATEGRFEFVDGEVFAMTGARVAHEALVMAIGATIWSHLRGRPCAVFGSNAKLVVDEDAFLPDLLVTCDPTDIADGDRSFIQHPCILVEVLSPSTADWDRGGKFERYRNLDSLREVLFVYPDRRRVELFALQDDGAWRLTAHGDGQRVPLRTIGLELSVDEIYRGVSLSKKALDRPPKERI
ncbi:MAG: Uma2 family endonuclease [Alphaproteobacteria bacterium]|nr:Uma2 family endonuclease [Alphaproteobacteria bacterium]